MPLSAHDFKQSWMYTDFYVDKIPSIYSSNMPDFLNWKYQSWQQERVFNWGFVKGDFWVRLCVENIDSLQTEYIYSIYDDLDSVFFYQVEPSTNRVLKTSYGSYLIEQDKRELDCRSISFRVNLKPNEKRDLYVLVKNVNENLFSPMDITTVEDYFIWEQDYHWKLGWYFGYLMVMLIVSAILFLWFKRVLFIWYCGYIFFWIVVLLQEDYFLGDILSGRLLYFISVNWQIVYIISGVSFGMLVMKELVNLRSYSTNLTKVLNLLVLLLFTYSLLVFIAIHFNNNAQLILNWKSFAIKFGLLLCLIAQLFSLFILVKLINAGNKNARIYLIGVSIFIFGCGNVFSNAFGITNYNVFNPNGIIVGLVLELLIFSILMIYDYYITARTNIILSKELLQNEISMTRIIADTQELEKQRIAKDLHDDLGGTLSLIKLTISDPQKAAENTQLISKAISDLRLSIFNLNDFGLHENGLSYAMQEYLKRIRNMSRLNVNYFDNGTEFKMNSNLKIIVYRIFSELINNVLKHAKAKTLNVNLEFSTNYFSMMIDDDGVGFSSTDLDTSKNIGLKTIAERCKLINAIFNYDTNKSGTTSILKIEYE
jgi:signal transduction histidine kinase